MSRQAQKKHYSEEEMIMLLNEEGLNPAWSKELAGVLAMCPFSTLRAINRAVGKIAKGKKENKQ